MGLTRAVPDPADPLSTSIWEPRKGRRERSSGSPVLYRIYTHTHTQPFKHRQSVGRIQRQSEKINQLPTDSPALSLIESEKNTYLFFWGGGGAGIVPSYGHTHTQRHRQNGRFGVSGGTTERGKDENGARHNAKTGSLMCRPQGDKRDRYFH